jgi:hypothetical protein
MNLPIIISNNREHTPIFLHLMQDGALPVGQPMTLHWCTKDGEQIRESAAQVMGKYVYDNITDLSNCLLMLWMGTPNAPQYLDSLEAWMRSEGIDPAKPLAFYVMAQNLT